MRLRLPEMPAVRAERLTKQYDITGDEALYLSADIEAADYFEALAREGISPRIALSWLNTHLLPGLRERKQELSESRITPSRLVVLLKMLAENKINTGAAREVLTVMFDSDETPEAIVKARGFEQLSDRNALESLVDRVIREHRRLRMM
jgi:aspartyl-tRNA(Asn)/glutamyl-tRNA(Gln) amidotransferase subunit B